MPKQTPKMSLDLRDIHRSESGAGADQGGEAQGLRDQRLHCRRDKEKDQEMEMVKEMRHEKLYMRLLIAVEIIWIMLLTCLLISCIQVITAHAEEPKQIINGEYVIAEIHTQDNAIDIQEGPPINDVSVALDEADAEKPVYASISMTDDEAQLLRSILALEADDATEGFDGQRAVVEVIFNRVLSPRWPDTVSDVIYQRGQFATVKYLKRPYNRPGEAEDDAISAVLRETETVLPSTDYVFFSRGKSNGKAFVKINHHWFSR